MLARILIFCLMAMLPATAAEITVAAASDLNGVLREIAADFERTRGHHVVLAFGSSGNFYSQIRNGAPYDIYMSADADYPSRLVSAGLGERETLYGYARGSIVIWLPNTSRLDPSTLREKSLLDDSIRKIAIANPKHAPYGRAAESALKSFGVWEQVAPRLVIGENISQAAQFVETGNAQAGIIALSLALTPAMKSRGKYWQIPDEAYAPLNQAAVVLKSSRQPAAAREFIEYLKGDAARTIFRRFGFREATEGR